MGLFTNKLFTNANIAATSAEQNRKDRELRYIRRKIAAAIAAGEFAVRLPDYTLSSEALSELKRCGYTIGVNSTDNSHIVGRPTLEWSVTIIAFGNSEDIKAKLLVDGATIL